MSDKVFLDTNILIYSYSTTEPKKQKVAQEVASNPEAVVSTQVINEMVNVLRKKFQVEWQTVGEVVNEIRSNFEVKILSLDDIHLACELAEKYRYSFFDSLILSSALMTECSILYSEDLQSSQVIEGKLQISNPFL